VAPTVPLVEGAATHAGGRSEPLKISSQSEREGVAP